MLHFNSKKNISEVIIITSDFFSYGKSIYDLVTKQDNSLNKLVTL